MAARQAQRDARAGRQRWCDAGSAPGVLEATKGFRRIKGCKDMPPLVAARNSGSGNRRRWLRSRESSRRWSFNSARDIPLPQQVTRGQTMPSLETYAR